MVDFITLKKIKSELREEEQEVEDLLKDIWVRFRDALNGFHEGERIWKSMEDHIMVVNGHIRNAEMSIEKGDDDAALKWLESAKNSNSVIEEFEDVLLKLERKELKNMLKMKKESDKIKDRINKLEKNIEKIRRAKAA